MSKTKIEKINGLTEKIQKLENKKSQLVKEQNEQVRKDRTKRFCKRHGLLEKYMPSLIDITDEQFESFIIRAIDTSYGRNILAQIINQAGTVATPNSVDLTQDIANNSSANPQTTAGSEA